MQPTSAQPWGVFRRKFFCSCFLFFFFSIPYRTNIDRARQAFLSWRIIIHSLVISFHFGFFFIINKRKWRVEWNELNITSYSFFFSFEFFPKKRAGEEYIKHLSRHYYFSGFTFGTQCPPVWNVMKKHRKENYKTKKAIKVKFFHRFPSFE